MLPKNMLPWQPTYKHDISPQLVFKQVRAQNLSIFSLAVTQFFAVWTFPFLTVIRQARSTLSVHLYHWFQTGRLWTHFRIRTEWRDFLKQVPLSLRIKSFHGNNLWQLRTQFLKSVIFWFQHVDTGLEICGVLPYINDTRIGTVHSEKY